MAPSCHVRLVVYIFCRPEPCDCECSLPNCPSYARMVSLRFPASFPQPKNGPNSSFRRPFHTAAVVCTFSAVTAAGVAAGIAITQNAKIRDHPMIRNTLNFIFSNIPSNHSSPFWASLSLSDSQPSVVESRTGMSFPPIVNDSQKLLGVGLRRKSIFGLKNIDVYAFGVYADESEVKDYLRKKFEDLSISEKELNRALMESDTRMTVRLQIVYGKLSIRSVRNAFEQSIGSRLQKYGGPDCKELLHRFTSQFKDEYKIPRGSVIELSREQGHVLRTRIDGKEVGSIDSELLCRSVLDLYIGDDPFDQQAKQDVDAKLASLVAK